MTDLLKFVRQLFCRHDWYFVAGNRLLVDVCRKCGKRVLIP